MAVNPDLAQSSADTLPAINLGDAITPSQDVTPAPSATARTPEPPKPKTSTIRIQGKDIPLSMVEHQLERVQAIEQERDSLKEELGSYAWLANYVNLIDEHHMPLVIDFIQECVAAQEQGIRLQEPGQFFGKFEPPEGYERMPTSEMDNGSATVAEDLLMLRGEFRHAMTQVSNILASVKQQSDSVLALSEDEQIARELSAEFKRNVSVDWVREAKAKGNTTAAGVREFLKFLLPQTPRATVPAATDGEGGEDDAEPVTVGAPTGNTDKLFDMDDPKYRTLDDNRLRELWRKGYRPKDKADRDTLATHLGLD